ncbi:hypothetical protein ACFYTS_11760 [Nocardia sp. NPDC004151]|uniref:hypothetical protein n=1 Tax=Nocardia sp. NPDC004151 TaxID=3364304 RepID=UPI0036BD6B10
MGGLVFGTGGLIELHHVDEFIELASEIGVILLFGLSTDPASMPPVLGWAVLLAVVTASTKIAGWRGCRAGRGRPATDVLALDPRSCPR